jgi:beta-glucosidase
VVSDANGIEDLYLKHRVAATPKEAVRLSIEAGVDTHLGFNEYAAYVLELVREGTLPESAIDRAVSWILQIKFELGLFENPYVDPERAAAVCNCAAHRELARETARQAMVLLKNEGDLLPLAGNVRSILVAGPNADRGRNQLGDYAAPGEAVTVLQGIRERAGAGVAVRYAQGCGVKELDASGIAEAVAAAKESDLAVLVLGESAWTEGMVSGEGNDRCTLDLPGVQQQLLEAVWATGTPVVLVLINGRPLTIGWAAEHVPAILEAWYPGQEGGHAVADVLWGDYNPGGRLPITFPRAVGQLPLFYNYKPTGRAYDYVDGAFAPLYAFGYGLSYTRFGYRDLAITPAAIRPGGHVQVAVTVENVGTRAGDEVVQLYLSDLVGSVVTPLKQLKGFARVTLQPGEQRVVEFTLGPKELALLDRHLEPAVEPGTFEVMVGGLKGTFEVE